MAVGHGQSAPNLLRDGWVSIAVAHDGFWEKLAHAVGRPELIRDERFATNAARVRNTQQVVDIIEAFTSVRSKAELAECFGGQVPFGPVYTSKEIFEDPHYRARGMLVEVEQPGSSTPVKIAGVPVKLSATPGTVRRRAPRLGEHTEDVLRAAGYDAASIAQLRAAGAIR